MRNTKPGKKISALQKELLIVGKGASWSLIGIFFARIITFLVVVLLTRTLKAYLFGLYVLGLTLTSFLARIASLGLDKQAVKSIPNLRGNPRKVKGLILTSILSSFTSALLVSSLLFLFSKQISFFFEEPLLEQPLKLFSFAIPLFVLLNSLGSCTRGFKTTKYDALGRLVIRNSIQLLFVGFFSFLGYKIFGMIGAYLIGLGSGSLFIFFGLKKLFPFLTNMSIKPIWEIKKTLKKSIPLIWLGMLIFLISWTDILMIGHFLSAKKIGIYEVAIVISNTIIIFSTVFLSIFDPILSEYFRKSRIKRLNKLFKIIGTWVLTLSLPILLVIFLSPKEILKIFGTEFVQGTGPVIILSFAQLMIVLTFGVSSVLAMTVYQNINAIIISIGIIANIIMNFLFMSIFKWGLMGAAMATLISIFLIRIIKIIVVYKKISLFSLSKRTLYVIAYGLLATIVAYLVKIFFLKNLHYFVNLVMTSLLFISIYFSLIVTLLSRPEDRFFFKKLSNKLKFK